MINLKPGETGLFFVDLKFSSSVQHGRGGRATGVSDAQPWDSVTLHGH